MTHYNIKKTPKHTKENLKAVFSYFIPGPQLMPSKELWSDSASKELLTGLRRRI